MLAQMTCLALFGPKVSFFFFFFSFILFNTNNFFIVFIGSIYGIHERERAGVSRMTKKGPGEFFFLSSYYLILTTTTSPQCRD